MSDVIVDFSHQALKSLPRSTLGDKDPSVVKRLILRSNQLLVLDPWVGSLCNQLQSLDLSGNQLQRIPSELCRLSTLTSVNLDANQLVSLLQR
mmetsp:Transcript_79456/g.140235  ORF Transcript_79456/g.140235 Transcript_79456/m.140235 type:complete len:93 (+) Transcript_79456:1780-2058(+)